MGCSFLLLLITLVCTCVGGWKSHGEYLHAVYFQSLTTIGIQQCAKRCLSRQDCKSINYHLPEYSCTLSAFDKNNRSLVQNSAYVYSQKDQMTKVFTDICSNTVCQDERMCVSLHDMKSHCAVRDADCNERLQWESNPLISVSASSTHYSCSIACSYLDSIVNCQTISWCANTNGQHEYFQFSFLKSIVIKGIIIQGRTYGNQWVKTYRVSVSDDNVNWTDLGQDFLGNSDQTTWVTSLFESGILTTYLRITPVQYNGHKSMKVDLIGC